MKGLKVGILALCACFLSGELRFAAAEEGDPVLALSGLAANASVRLVPLLKSSASAEAASVSVREGPSPAEGAAWAGLAAGFLRSSLLSSGARVMASGTPSDFEAVASVYGGPKGWAMSVELWDRRTGTLASSLQFQPPGPPPSAAQRPPSPNAGRGVGRRIWIVSAGMSSHAEAFSWLVGAAYRFPRRRFEVGLDAGAFRNESSVITSVPGVVRNYSVTVTYIDLRSSILQRVDEIPGVRRVLPWPAVLRAGAGLGLYQFEERVRLQRGTFPSFDYAQPISRTAYVRPLFEAGVGVPFGPLLELDARAQVLPGFPVPEGLDYRSVNFLARLALKLPL